MSLLYRYNPIVVFVYFASVLSVSMLTLNPIILVMSLFFGSLLNYQLNGVKANKTLLCSVLVIVLSAIVNPFFVSRGGTKLVYIFSRLITLESIVYGAIIGLMISGVFTWFCSYNKLMHSEKTIYLFGRIAPKVATILTLSLSLIPKFRRQQKLIEENLSFFIKYSNIFQKLKYKLKVVSILITWAIESSITTTESMQARGYGRLGGSKISRYGFHNIDFVSLVLFLSGGVLLVVMMIFGFGEFYFYPYICRINFSRDLGLYILTLVYMSCFIIIDLGEKARWHLLKLKI